ncbi:chemical-damaging agent resistance protein C [Acrocarpospora corrugata]|uniref:Chemical-damaging agent resistance protein C n=1 Tax=Acrocarpospora corrugata TaxID=35763 RepID=A0A5M3VX10_9ACTN|nr:TerD family protein [Acrocarpospora corrugata]GER98937.1 chemical-damaging agent resistance protein C [Acrocarpospora corrugata]
MSVKLSKGENFSLTQTGADLSQVVIELGWTPRATVGADFDLDASALMVGPGDRALSDEHFIYYNNLRSPEGAVRHEGDDRDGQAKGERIWIDLGRVPAQCVKIIFTVSIHLAIERRQNFGQVRDAYITVSDGSDDLLLGRFDLAEDYAGETAMIFGELYWHRAEWKFRAVEQGYREGLERILRAHGVDVE